MNPRAIIEATLSVCFGALIFCAHGAETETLQFVNPDLQLGAVAADQDVPVTFVLTNCSDKAVKIANVDTSCRCTSVQKAPDEIPAHGSGAVELNFNSSRSDGSVTQSVTVETVGGQIFTGQFSATVGSVSAVVTIAPWVPDRGDGTYQNPVLNADYSDPDAVRVGDDFYLVSSSFHVAPGLPVLHSKDLVNWTIINHVLPAQPPLDHFSVPRHGEGVWAPAIRFHDGKFWVFYPDPDFGIYFSTATNPAGEWTPPQLVEAGRGLIDPCPFWDDDGQLYLVHGWAKSRAGIANLLTLQKLSPEGTKILDAGEVIIDGNKIPNWTTLEGPKLYKRHGFYYVFAPSGGVTGGYQAVFRATNIFGPYEHRIVLDQGKTAINGPHQGAWVDTPTGENWFLHFQDRGAYGRVVHLEPMVWRDDDWPVIGDDPDHTGKGQPVLVHAKPNVGKTYPITEPQTSDEFDGQTLGLQWQWNANPRDEWISFSAHPGFLRLASVPAPLTRNNGTPATKNIYDAPNFLLQKFPATEFTVTTEMEFAPAADGEIAGLTVFGYDYALLGLRKTAGGVRLVYVVNSGASRGAEEREVASVDTKNSPAYLRVTVSNGARCQFAYSFDNQTFTPIGEPFRASVDRWIGAKVGVIASAPADATKTGFADFDWFHVTPTIP
jgi:beta-xylosidase